MALPFSTTRTDATNHTHAQIAQALTLLGRFISVKEPNIRYLGLEALGRFAQLEQLGDGGLESIKKHQATVFVSLKASKQSSTRRGAFRPAKTQLTYHYQNTKQYTNEKKRMRTCRCGGRLWTWSSPCATRATPRTSSGASRIRVKSIHQPPHTHLSTCVVQNQNRELTTNLATADAAIREEMVLKIAVLAERYATDLRWYVDTVLQLIHLAGDYVADDVWHRVVQVRTLPYGRRGFLFVDGVKCRP